MAGLYKVVNQASVRNGPNKSDTIIGKPLEKNTEVTVTEIVRNDKGLEVAMIIKPLIGYIKLKTSRNKVLLEKIGDLPGAVLGMPHMGNPLHPQGGAADPLESTVMAKVRKKGSEEFEKRQVKVSNIGDLQYFNTHEKMIKLASKLRETDRDLYSVSPKHWGNPEIIDERNKLEQMILRLGDIWFISNHSNCASLALKDETPEEMDIMSMIQCLKDLPRGIHKDILWCLKEYLRYKIEELELQDEWHQDLRTLKGLLEGLPKFAGGGKRKKKSKRRKTQKKKSKRRKTHKKKLKNRESKRRTIKYRI